jgi:hypothetical protein
VLRPLVQSQLGAHVVEWQVWLEPVRLSAERGERGVSKGVGRA